MYKFSLLVTAIFFAFHCGCNEAKLTDQSVNLGKIRVVERPDTDRKNQFYVSNRKPLLPSPFIKLPIRSVEPKEFEASQSLQMIWASVGDLGVAEDKLVQVESLQVLQANVGDLGAVEEQSCEVGQPLQVLQASIGDLRAAEF